MNGQIVKFIGNMQQGAKKIQNTKVDKNIVKASDKVIGNLMAQIGDEDENDEKEKIYVSCDGVQ